MMSGIVLIGGCPSSGSTALVNLLSRFPGVLALPETGLFCHGELVVRRVPDNVPSPLSVRVPWVNTAAKVQHALGGDMDLFQGLAATALGGEAYLRSRFDPNERHLIVEKTPENVFAFWTYLASNPHNRVVVTSRNAQSVVSSLVRRGFNLVDAVIFWFAHCYEVARIVSEFPERVYHCRYEAFTDAPKEIAQEILEFVGQGKLVPEQAGEDEHEREARRQLEMSSWLLEGTAWQRSPNEPVARSREVAMIGIDLDVLMDRLVLAVDGQYLRPCDLDRCIATGETLPSRIARVDCEPLPSGFTRETITEYLTPIFVPFVLSG